MIITRFVGETACSARRYSSALADPASAVIDTFSAERNVTLRFELDGSPVQLPLRDMRADLVDLAISVFIADEFIPRDESPDGWARELEFVVPVRGPQPWRRTSGLLRRTLRFLSGDQYTFHWPERRALPRRARHRRALPRDYDVVCLFSGGIDSLLGAVELLEAGKRVLLVGHQAEGATASAQTSLADSLRSRYPEQLALLQCRVARAHVENPAYPLPEKVEDSHRPRSFLFLSIAAAIANIVGVPDIYIPENGLIALNVPLQASRLGTLSTRTAHPIFLRDMSLYLRQLGMISGSIRNPFMFQSKTDMLRNADAAFHDLLLRSVSCSRPLRYQNLGVRHCGYCVPCLYRRGAMAAIGLDRSTDYAFDGLAHLPDLSEILRADFRALVGFAKRAATVSEAALDRMVLSHGPFSPSVGAEIGPADTLDYSPWTSMIRSWAIDFLAFVQTNASTETKDMLDINSSNATRK